MPLQFSHMFKSPFVWIATSTGFVQSLGTFPASHTVWNSSNRYSSKTVPTCFTTLGIKQFLLPDLPFLRAPRAIFYSSSFGCTSRSDRNDLYLTALIVSISKNSQYLTFSQNVFSIYHLSSICRSYTQLPIFLPLGVTGRIPAGYLQLMYTLTCPSRTPHL